MLSVSWAARLLLNLLIGWLVDCRQLRYLSRTAFISWYAVLSEAIYVVLCTERTIVCTTVLPPSECIYKNDILFVEMQRCAIVSGFVKQGEGSPDESRLEQTPYPFQPH